MHNYFMCVVAVTAAIFSLSADSLDKETVAKWESGGRAEMLEWFSRNWFGKRPVERPADEVIGDNFVSFACGRKKIDITLFLPPGANASNPVPAIMLADHLCIATRAERIKARIDLAKTILPARGYAFIYFNLNDVTSNTVRSVTVPDSVNVVLGGMGRDDSWGTISAWAWGCSRVMDWVETRPELDAKRIAVVGHSRGGKTALWAGCTDKRFALTISNCSGTGGARSLHTQCDKCETVEWMSKNTTTSSWFCPNWFKYAGRESEIEHDVDDMMKLVAPRLLYVASGSLDVWAGPPGEFASAKKASSLWNAYGLKGLSIDKFPAPGVWDHSGKVGYHLRPGKHDLARWDWEKYMDFMDRHLPGPALHGRVADLYTRIYAANAKGPETDRTCRMKAWRGERVHAQTVTWCATPCGKVRLDCSVLKSKDGAELPSGALLMRPVKDVAGVPDLLDCAGAAEIGKDCFMAAWVTVNVPRDAKPGIYSGKVSVTAIGGRKIEYPVEVEVLAKALPEKNPFYLDLWQDSCGVARYHHVKPYSKEHYVLLEPIFKELAAAGQKAITVPICKYPWGKTNSDMRYLPMVRDVRYPDGRCELDFTVFDEYVEFARRCGIGPHIHCYTILKFAHRFTYWYIDGETGEERSMDLDPDTAEWKAFWSPFLAKFEAHVREKGWLDDTYIAIDEGDPPDQFSTVAFLKKAAPSLKYACAANKDGRLFKGLDADVYSQIIWKDFCSKDFLDTIPARRAKGQITTFYVCTQPQKPNTWFKSPLIETEWMGLYAAAKGFDGFLRWSMFNWKEKPFEDVVSGHFPAGEIHLIYPGPKASTRWELLRDSIEDYRKIAVLKAAGKSTAELDDALAAIDFEAAKTDDEEAYRRKISAVLQAIDKAASSL